MIARVQWCDAGFERAFEALQARLGDTTWPTPPEGFELLTPGRPMRLVMRGVLPGADGDIDVVVKWSRPDTLADQVSRHVRGGKGVREGRVLRTLAAAGVPVPRALAFVDEDFDALVTAEERGLEPAPQADDATPAQIHAVAHLLAGAHGAGLRHRDLHGGNLAFRDGAPMLIDLGGSRTGPPLPENARIRALARLHHSLLGGARRTQRLRALRAYLAAAGDEDPRASARALADGIEERARVIRRRYRRGRDRRATRTGKHFQRFDASSGARGIRCRDHTDEDWWAWAEQRIEEPPADAYALKEGGRVLRAPGPADGAPIVLKYYGSVSTGRLPRSVRAFRRAYALQNRGVPVPQPLLALAAAGGDGLYVAAWIDAPNLQAFAAGGRGGAYADLSPGRRRRFLTGLGRMLRAMHEAEVTHRDLKPPNLLAVDAEQGGNCVIVDLDGARIRKGPVSWARRARDLARLDAGLDARTTDRLRVLRAYYDVLPRPPVSLRALAERIGVHVRRKRGPEGLPR